MKKKLTKTQVKKKILMVRRALFDLFFDKFQHGSESFIPMSSTKLEQMHKAFMNAFLRLK